MRDLYLENDEFDEFVKLPCLTKRCKDRRKEREENLRKTAITSRVNVLKSKLPEYFDSVNAFSNKITDKSVAFLTQLKLEGTRLFNTANSTDKFSSKAPSTSKNKNVRVFVKDRERLINSQIARLVSADQLKNEREANRKRLFNDLFANHFWITKSLTPSNLYKITDTQIEEALLVAEEYLMYENDSATVKIYENKVQTLIKEQQSRLSELEEEEEEEEDETDGSNGSDGSDGSDGGIKDALNKYKWYIGGALVLGVVGIIVIRKI
jgi:hypothetical protein